MNANKNLRGPVSLTIAATICMAMLAFLPTLGVDPPVEVWVDDDYTGSTPGWGTTHFKTIQEGIDAVSASGTVNVAAGTYTEYLHITTDGLTIVGAGIDQSIIDLDGLTPYWHYPCGTTSYASRAGVLISGYGSTDQVVEDVTFKGFTVKNAGLNPPITATGTHTGSDNALVLTDSTNPWNDNNLVGQWVHNYGDRDTDYKPARSYGQITAYTATTVTATLSGGKENDWDHDDQYLITPYEHFHNSFWIHYPNYDGVRGISISNGKNILIQDCKITHSGYGGITTGYARCVSTHKYSEYITIDNCIITDHPTVGINIGNNVGPFTITNNVCERNKRPAYHDATREYSGYGIQVSGTKNYGMASGLIANNICSDNGFEGIVVSKYTDGVTVENNEVTGHNFDQDGAGIFMYHWGHPEWCKNHIIRNNIVTGNIRGIVAYYAQHCTIEGNTITTDSGTFARGQGAIKLDNANNIQVKDNVISCDGTGITVMSYSLSCNSNNNEFTGNTITGAKFAGVLIYGPGARDNTFECNTITGTTSLTLWSGTPWIETQADGVFIDDDAGTGNVFHYNDIYGNAADGMENQLTTTVDAEFNWWGDASGPSGQGTGTGDAVSTNVDYSPWLGYTVGTTPMTFHTNDNIQDAIDEASNGDTIVVHDGTYYENIVVDKALTLQAGSTPIIDGDTTGDPAPDGSCITISADSVTINGFEITNGYNGILGETSNSVITNNIIHDHLNYIGSNGVGICLWGDNDNNQILNNEIYNNDRQGIFIGYDDFDGDPSTTPKISSGNTLSGNTIDNNGLYTQPKGPDASAYGIQLWNADGNTIENNEIKYHDDWFPWVGSTSDFAQGIYLCAAFDNTVTCNDLHHNNYGVGAWSAGRTPLGDNNQIHCNSIHDNTGYGVISYDVTLDATQNWWGDVSGPKHSSNSGGSGDTVSDNVDFDPWLTYNPLTSSLVYTGVTIVPYQNAVVLEATLSDSTPAEISGVDVDFYLSGDYEGSATTDSYGVARLNIGSKLVGVYEVSASVGCLETGTAYVAVYDPSAGFVTGGGWIESPAGALTADPTAEGKASFGFVAKYNKKTSAAEGNTQFVFKAGDLNFHSNNYDWLVVNQGGINAQFKGTGTINGEGEHQFMLWAKDSDPDIFRIKIWEEDEFGVETVIYDNGFNQAIGGGSIVVHTKK